MTITPYDRRPTANGYDRPPPDPRQVVDHLVRNAGYVLRDMTALTGDDLATIRDTAKIIATAVGIEIRRRSQALREAGQ